MSTQKLVENSHGGARAGSGRGAGDKMKICVSVDEENWQSALAIWKNRPSWLVNDLIADYVAANEKSLTEAAV